MHILLWQAFRNDNLFNAKGANAGMRNMTKDDTESEAGDSWYNLPNTMLWAAMSYLRCYMPQ